MAIAASFAPVSGSRSPRPCPSTTPPATCARPGGGGLLLCALLLASGLALFQFSSVQFSSVQLVQLVQFIRVCVLIDVRFGQKKNRTLPLSHQTSRPSLFSTLGASRSPSRKKQSTPGEKTWKSPLSPTLSTATPNDHSPTASGSTGSTTGARTSTAKPLIYTPTRYVAREGGADCNE